MKNTIKTMLMVFAAALVLSSCTEDPTPPVAGFTLSNMEPIQWDKSAILETPIGADEITYTITGGEYYMVDEATIQFLEAGTYTITQTVTNSDGTDNSSLDVVVTEPNNTYTIDGTEMSFGSSLAYWKDATAQGGTIYIRMEGPIEGTMNSNLVKLFPVAGPNPLEGTYTWAADGAIGTYDAGVTYNWDGGFSYDWTTNGDNGDDLIIELVYEDTANSDFNIYDITLSSYTLNHGNWDWVTFTWVSDGTKSLAVSYRGAIAPPQ